MSKSWGDGRIVWQRNSPLSKWGLINARICWRVCLGPLEVAIGKPKRWRGVR